MKPFQSTEKTLFFSKNDPQDPRLGDLAKSVPVGLSKNDYDTFLKSQISARDFVIAGYPDDEGIRINGGRPGAAQAPAVIRKYLYKMTPGLFCQSPPKSIWDLGDLRTTDCDLATRHETAAEWAELSMQADAHWIALGGGHDYGFAEASAFARTCLEKWQKRPLILNFDAHLDVRPAHSGLSSGTPFYRLLETFPEIDFAEIGIQGQCNSRAHLDWCQAKGARVLTYEETQMSGVGFAQQVLDFLGEWILRPRPALISIDIDGFSNAFAPGCSQSWATGFEPMEFFKLFAILLKRLDVRALGIYETSPPLDQDDRTSKLAAQILHRYIYPVE
jgi:formiminoglutamase